jgi:hypothetical protein
MSKRIAIGLGLCTLAVAGLAASRETKPLEAIGITIIPQMFGDTSGALASTSVQALSTPASLSGQVFVDCSAATAGDGSSGQPLNSLAQLDTVIQPGTSIFFRRGVRCTGQFRSQGSGTFSNPIRVAAYGNGTQRPIIDGNGITGLYAAGAAVLLRNQEYWRITDLEVVNQAATQGLRNGILILLDNYINGSDQAGRAQGVARGIYIDNVYVHDVSGGAGANEDQSKSSNGIQFAVIGTDVPNWFDDIKVTNSRISKVDRSGLVTFSQQKCRQYFTCQPNQNGLAPFNAWRPFTRVFFGRNQIDQIGGDGIVIRVSSGALVQDNRVFDIATKDWTFNGSSVGVWAINSNNTEFSFNEVFRVRKLSTNNDGTAFDADYSNFGLLFKQNYSHDNEGGFMLLCGECGAGTRTVGVLIRDNISINDGTTAARLISAVGAGYRDSTGTIVEGAELIGNSFFVPRTSSLGIIERKVTTTSISFKNNIVYSTSTLTPFKGDSSSISVAWDSNIFFGMAPAVAPANSQSVFSSPAWVGPLPSVAPTGYAGLSAYRNYELLAAFRLGDGSPALSRGAKVYSTNVGDFFGGNKRPTKCNPDIGAHQRTIVTAECL